MRVISRITDSGNFWTRSESRGSSIARSSRLPPPYSLLRRPRGAGRRRPAKTCRASIKSGHRHPCGEAPRLSERFFDYWRIDVFTDTPLTGNPLAVFPRATGLSPAEMLGIAREMNISETTFIFPASNPSANYRNRIFTPGGEIAFAGHPSIGTAFVAAQEGLVPHPDGSSVIYEELEIGVLPLELICEGGQVRKVIMTQGEPSLGAELKNVEPLAGALGVRAKDVGLKGLVPQIAATGIQSLQVPIRSLEVVKGLDPDLRDLRKVLSKFGEKVVCYAFALEAVAPDAAVHARGFAPDLGIEDPATGSAAGASRRSSLGPMPISESLSFRTTSMSVDVRGGRGVLHLRVRRAPRHRVHRPTLRSPFPPRSAIFRQPLRLRRGDRSSPCIQSHCGMVGRRRVFNAGRFHSRGGDHGRSPSLVPQPVVSWNPRAVRSKPCLARHSRPCFVGLRCL